MIKKMVNKVSEILIVFSSIMKWFPIKRHMERPIEFSLVIFPHIQGDECLRIGMGILLEITIELLGEIFRDEAIDYLFVVFEIIIGGLGLYLHKSSDNGVNSPLREA